ncbi:hypothetical protein [Chamaesiphon sp. GL140_3_metabinner_50]|uniref:hypothetical protein n=1 Tax=Chamaesiphon sp. GL140_3_metabinner_50 TaxID=2970812 RepID=UPI0025DA54D2|nr:hypothetical protein [Chamaesiphon sp. GL140_3_metabinner_50]
MLKATSLALSLLAVIAIAPASQAATNAQPLSLQQPAANLHSQIILKIGGQQEDRGVARRRELELERERAAARRQNKYYSQRRSYVKYDKNSYNHRENERGEYRRDR